MWFSRVDFRNGAEELEAIECEEPEAIECEELEADETTDLYNGATELTKETDPLCERLFNSTRARFAREGGQDPTEHTSTLIVVLACSVGSCPPSSRPCGPAPRRIQSLPTERSVLSVGSVAPL
jgi:hypothetical protein